MRLSLCDKILFSAGAVFIGAIYAVFLYAPTEKVMGPIQKIFYFHLSSAFVAFVSFFIAFICGIVYLVSKKRKWDNIGAASVEIGLVFTTLVLITGVLWGRPVWNTWWTWDPRLTTSLVLWFIYSSYLILRSSVARRDKRAVYCAVLAIVGFVDVPIVFLSARLWRTIHPVVIRSDSIDMAPAMLTTLIISLAAFTLLWGLILRLRSTTLIMEDKLRTIKQQHYGDLYE